MRREECPVVFRTRGPGFHFFGYYDKSPIDRSGRRMLSHRANFDWKRMPRPDDVIDLGYWDLESGTYTQLAETRAFNWQQGSMLQWLGPDFERRIVFNDREGDRFVARVVDIEDGSVRTLPMPIYTLHPDGGSAICVNFERLTFTHPGYDYQGIENLRWDGVAPEGDGLFRMDLESGDARLVIATREMLELQSLSSMAGARHYLEHAMFNPDGSRFCFLHRWALPDGGTYARFLSARPDGSEVLCLLDSGYVSHFGWRDADRIVGWGRPPSVASGMRQSRVLSQFVLKPLLPIYRRLVSRTGPVRAALTGDTYLVFDTGGAKAQKLTAQPFPDDGHCTWRPGDPRWMLTDTYEDEEYHRHLLLYDAREDEIVEIGNFYSVRETCSTGFRCDLHPRWDRSGNRVVIDSTHEGDERQMYVIDVSGVVSG